MEGGSFLGTLLAGALLLFLGSVLVFAGYRLFLILLPIYGFFFGLSWGAHSVQALFGDGFLSTTTSWVVGFFAGLVFALLSYFFWVFAVALVAGALGYALVTGFFSLVDADLDALTWILAVAVAIVFGIGAVVLNLEKSIVIVATSLQGAWTIVGTFLFVSIPATPASIAENGANVILDDHPLWFLIFAIVAAAGMVVQFQMNRGYEIERYNRWEASIGGVKATPPPSA
jgi:Domain of unknown function (DUF4203)